VFDLLYPYVSRAILAYCALSVLIIFLILKSSSFFCQSPRWRHAMLFGLSVLFVGLVGDLADGISDQNGLRQWILIRNSGLAILLTSVAGLHWDKFSPILFEGSKLFNNPLMRKLFRYK
jgi:hypothetical protein